VINEAIHYGTPVITTEAAGAKQLLNQENIYNPGDVEQLNTLLKKHFQKQESGKANDIRSGIRAIKRTIEEFS
jgi:protein-arginine kinase activator protein McsA